jgi:hypothetical protein
VAGAVLRVSGTTSRQVLAVLYKHFAQRYACLTEVTVTELVASNGRFPIDRRCDLLLVGKGERINVEIKVTRADFLADVADPAKQAAWQHYTHRWAYAVPPDLVRPEEVPTGWGLLLVGEHVAEWARRAPKHPQHTPAELPPRVQYALMHRLARVEAHAKGYGWDRYRDGDDPEALRATVERLRRDVEIANDARMRAEGRAREWQRAFGVGNPVPCAICAQPLRSDIRRASPGGWRHAAEHEVVCHTLREAKAREDQHQRGYAGRERVYVPPPYPADALEESA